MNALRYEFHSRSTLGQDDSQLLLIDNSAGDNGHNRNLNGIPARRFVVARRVGEGRVISKSEAVVPSAKKRVARPELEDAEGGALLALGHRRRGPQLRSRDVTNEIIVVRVADSGGKQERQRGQDMGGAALVVCLRLMRNT